MFRKREPTVPASAQPAPTERITTVLGNGTAWKGNLTGTGGVRIEGAFEGDITLRGVLVVGETGRLTCDQIVANLVIIAGAVRSNITAEKVEIRSTGRVWGDVLTAAFATEEGAFLRGQIRMEDRVEIRAPSPPSKEPVPEEEYQLSEEQESAESPSSDQEGEIAG